jgi:hypothetical protein
MKNARKPMPHISWMETPNPGLQFSVNIKNNTEHTASKVKLTVYNPDRKKIFYPGIKDINLEYINLAHGTLAKNQEFFHSKIIKIVAFIQLIRKSQKA